MTDPTATETIGWNNWLRRWDAQQEVYITDRERRFEVMVSFLEALLPPDLVALDLAAGPGSASARLLLRLPGSRSVAVDADPVLLRLGQGADHRAHRRDRAGGPHRPLRTGRPEPGAVGVVIPTRCPKGSCNAPASPAR